MNPRLARGLFLLLMLLWPAMPAAAQSTPAPTTATATPTPTPVPLLPPGDARDWGEWLAALWPAYGGWMIGIVILGVLALVASAYFSGWLERFKERGKEDAGGFVPPKPATKPTTDPFAEATRLYVERFAEYYSRFTFRGLEDVSGARTPPFNKAYISLRLAPPARGEAARETGRDAARDFLREGGAAEITLTEAARRYARLAIVGAAGSGKTTLLQWAGVTAARAQLPGDLGGEQRDLMAVIGQPLPIFVALRDFVKFCRRPEAPRSFSPAALAAFIAHDATERFKSIAFPPDFFERHLRQGGLLLLDGVDEVAPDDRAAVREAVEGFIVNYGVDRVRYLLTSRSAAYKGRVEFADFERLDVQPLSREQRDELVRYWCDAVYLPDEAAGSARELSASIDRSDRRVRDLARTPLMVAIFVLVYYHNQHKLPKQRAEFYHRAARVLVGETLRPNTPDYPAWEPLTVETRLDRIMRIAWELYTRGQQDATADELREWTAGEFPGGANEARAFFAAAANRSGLLEERGGQYGFFTHKTFHEYLAGLYLAQALEDRWAEELALRLTDDNWLEVTLLAAGALAYLNAKKAEKFVQLLSGLGASPEERAAALERAALAQADFPPDRAQANRPGLTERCQQALADASRPPAQRRALGLALAALGDPRLPPPSPEEEWARFRLIPAGPARLGTSEADIKLLAASEIDWHKEAWFKVETPAHTVQVSEFRLAQWPVTNAEFARFAVGAKGYENKDYWSADGWRWRQGEWEPDLSVYTDRELRKNVEDWLKGRPVDRRHQPFFLEDPAWNARNLPVVGVTWFEAEAYANWLNEHLRGQLPDGWRVRLPTEAEWEKAARRAPTPTPALPRAVGGAGEGGAPAPGEGRSLWPWGDAWDPARCNSEESGLDATTPVGAYPHGASTDGVEDLIGNVWEWCLDAWDAKAYAGRDGATDPFVPKGNVRLVRGGAFHLNRRYCRAASRDKLIPVSFHQLLGVRVCASPILHSDL